MTDTVFVALVLFALVAVGGLIVWASVALVRRDREHFRTFVVLQTDQALSQDAVDVIAEQVGTKFGDGTQVMVLSSGLRLQDIKRLRVA
jgi:phosphatidylglycerophosphate synthase